MKNIANDHFDTEKPHTKIKHRLFKSALDTSLSIANGINYSKKENKPYIYIDLFAGAGGLSEGLSEAGFHSLFASEIMPVYAATYQKTIRLLKS